PVDVDRTGHMSRGVEQCVFIGFDEANAGVTRVLGHPVGAREDVGVGVALLFNGRSHSLHVISRGPGSGVRGWWYSAATSPLNWSRLPLITTGVRIPGPGTRIPSVSGV